MPSLFTYCQCILPAVYLIPLQHLEILEASIRNKSAASCIVGNTLSNSTQYTGFVFGLLGITTFLSFRRIGLLSPKLIFLKYSRVSSECLHPLWLDSPPALRLYPYCLLFDCHKAIRERSILCASDLDKPSKKIECSKLSQPYFIIALLKYTLCL